MSSAFLRVCYLRAENRQRKILIMQQEGHYI